MEKKNRYKKISFEATEGIEFVIKEKTGGELIVKAVPEGKEPVDTSSYDNWDGI